LISRGTPLDFGFPFNGDGIVGFGNKEGNIYRLRMSIVMVVGVMLVSKHEPGTTLTCLFQTILLLPN